MSRRLLSDRVASARVFREAKRRRSRLIAARAPKRSSAGGEPPAEVEVLLVGGAAGHELSLRVAVPVRRGHLGGRRVVGGEGRVKVVAALALPADGGGDRDGEVRVDVHVDVRGDQRQRPPALAEPLSPTRPSSIR